MRQKYIDAVNSFEPYSAVFAAGASPADVKAAIIELLSPYVVDRNLLDKRAVSVLANEALCVAQLSSRPDWKALLEEAMSLRDRAIATDKLKAFEVLCFFEEGIREAQNKYSLQISFETAGDGLTLNEYAFEMFRIIGALIESAIQPYLKELLCFAAIVANKPIDPSEVSSADLGAVVEMLSLLLPTPNFLSPPPWRLRINQWRNIAQHDSYTVTPDRVVATYGRRRPAKQVRLSREEVGLLGRELVQRLGALKSSRELTILNHVEELGILLPETVRDEYGKITELTAAFATQGFRLTEFHQQGGHVTARFNDIAPAIGPDRHIHCSQFIIAIAQRFPDVRVEVQYRSECLSGSWIFAVSAENLKLLLQLEDPWQRLVEVLEFKEEHCPNSSE